MSQNPGPRLALPTDVTTTLFRLLDNRLRSDPLLRSTVKFWQTWRGEVTDKQDPARTSFPFIGLYPVPQSELWWSPESQLGTLTVRLTAGVQGTCVDDALNLWAAVRRAVYPPDDLASLQNFRNACKAASRYKGLWELSQPAADQSPDAGTDGMFVLTGMLRIQYLATAAS